MKTIRVLALLGIAILVSALSPSGAGIVELAAAMQDSTEVSAAKTSLSKIQASMKTGQWNQLMSLLSDKGKNAFVMEVFSVLAVNKEIADLDGETLPPELKKLTANVAIVNTNYQLDEIGSLIFAGNSQEALKKIEATKRKWEIVAALWQAQSGSPFHVHPAFGHVVAAEVDGDSVYLDIEMKSISGVKSDDAVDFDMGGPAQVIRMTKVGNQWKYEGLDEQRSIARMEKFLSEADPQVVMSQSKLLDDPSFTATTYDDKEISLSDFKGKIVILDFWGTWCGPCVRSMPEMKLIRETFAKHGVEIVGVAVDTKQNVAAFCDKSSIAWPNIVDPDAKLADRFGVTEFPTLMMIDQKGNHVHADIKKVSLVTDLVTRLGLNQQDFAGLKVALDPKAAKTLTR